jgi:hypothetical protein
VLPLPPLKWSAPFRVFYLFVTILWDGREIVCLLELFVWYLFGVYLLFGAWGLSNHMVLSRRSDIRSHKTNKPKLLLGPVERKSTMV